MRIVVGVMRGGPSGYDDSLKTGASMLGALNKDTYEARDIFVDKAGQWHVHGLPQTAERALRGVDVALNALHGHFGEDGSLGRQLEAMGVRFAGTGAYGASTAYNKQAMRTVAAAAGMRIPYGTVIDPQKITDLEATATNLFRSLPQPSVVRPAVGNGNALLADSYHALVEALRETLAQGGPVLVEEYINGRAAAVGIIDNFRNQDTYALIPQPNVFNHDEKELLAAAAKQAHQALGLRHYSQVRLRVGRRGVYLTGAYTLPHLSPGSTLYDGLDYIGAPLPLYVDHIVQLALKQ